MEGLRSLFLKYLAQTSPDALALPVTRAEGFFLYGPNGEKWLDLISGIGVSALGHGHAGIHAAIKEQMDQHLHVHVYGEAAQSPQVKLAKALLDTLPKQLNRVYFTNSGTEAVEGAMKLTKKFTGRSKFLALDRSYHGSTQGALSLMGNPYYKEGYTPLLPEVGFLRPGEERDLDRVREDVAAVFVELVQGEAGARVLPDDWVRELRDRCTAYGVLLVVDECQTGFHRTGPMYAFDDLGVVPDVLILAKALGGGLPLGAFIAGDTVMMVLSQDPVLGHITTFGGHPLSCAAGLAFLQALKSEVSKDSILARNKLFREWIAEGTPYELRGRGLLLALDLNNKERVLKAIPALQKAGILTDWFLHNENCLRFAPALNIPKELIQSSMGLLSRTLEKTA